MLIWWVVFLSVLGSIGAILAASILLSLPTSIRWRMSNSLISYATGTLLASAFLGMIPLGLSTSPAKPFFVIVLIGIIIFFILEKLMIWRHCHNAHCEAHTRAAPLILVGDGFHNFVDGVVITSALLVSVPLGVMTTFAVLAHEIPQEVSDFTILLESGYSTKKAFLLNALSASTTLPGALMAYFSLSLTQGYIPYVLALSSSSFIYIAMADLVPMLHRKVTFSQSVNQVISILLGIVTIVFIQWF